MMNLPAHAVPGSTWQATAGTMKLKQMCTQLASLPRPDLNMLRMVPQKRGRLISMIIECEIVGCTVAHQIIRQRRPSSSTITQHQHDTKRLAVRLPASGHDCNVQLLNITCMSIATPATFSGISLHEHCCSVHSPLSACLRRPGNDPLLSTVCTAAAELSTDCRHPVTKAGANIASARCITTKSPVTFSCSACVPSPNFAARTSRLVSSVAGLSAWNFRARARAFSLSRTGCGCTQSGKGNREPRTGVSASCCRYEHREQGRSTISSQGIAEHVPGWVYPAGRLSCSCTPYTSSGMVTHHMREVSGPFSSG